MYWINDSHNHLKGRGGGGVVTIYGGGAAGAAGRRGAFACASYTEGMSSLEDFAAVGEIPSFYGRTSLSRDAKVVPFCKEMAEKRRSFLICPLLLNGYAKMVELFLLIVYRDSSDLGPIAQNYISTRY